MTEKKKFKLSITILIIIAIILIDQVSKILVINFVKQDVGIITLIKKSEEIKIADVIISILSDCVVFTVIIKFLKEQSKYMSTKVKYSLAVILGGGISNCIDKIWNGEVKNRKIAFGKHCIYSIYYRLDFILNIYGKEHFEY